MCQTKSISRFVFHLSLSFPWGVLLCLDQLALRKACVGGREQRLVQLIQLMKDLCSKSSCLPLSACKFPVCLIAPLNSWVAREPERGEWCFHKPKWDEGERETNIKMYIAPTLCWRSSVSSIWNCGGCVVWPWSNNKLWDYSDPDCSMHIDKKSTLLHWEGKMGYEV